MSSAYVLQRYQAMYLKIDDNLMTEVESLDVSTTDGGEDIATLVRGLAGRASGAAKATINFNGFVPYKPTDTGGAGLDSGGLTTGKGLQLDETMLTNLNKNGGLPVNFILMVGSPAAQKLYFAGNINSMKFSAAVGKAARFSANATGEFSTFISS